MTALSSPQWPIDDLVVALRGLHAIAANEAADRLSALAAVVAAVHAALDQYDRDDDTAAAETCVTAIAKAVEL